MKKHRTSRVSLPIAKLALTAAIGLAITLTLTACGKGGGDTFTDPRDKKTYKTVKIGEQVWMAENLNYEDEGSKCYDGEETNCKKYGRLYYWGAAMEACPSGWHLPSKDEWQTLVNFAGGENAGKALKATSGWNQNGNGTDNFGFSALPGGYHDGGCDCDDGSQPSFESVGDDGYWWSSSEYDSYRSYILGIRYKDENVYYDSSRTFDSRNVRCLMDDAKYTEAKKAEAAAAKAKAEEEAAAYIKANGGTFTDSRDKKTYKTINIREQVWMAENLNYETKGSECDSCQKYGRTYDWETAMKACPSGWKLPSEKEWDELRYASYSFSSSKGLEPGEILEPVFGRNNGYWWTADESADAGRAYSYTLFNQCTDDGCYGANSAKDSYNFVRCLQGNGNTLTDTRDKKTYKTVKIGTQTWMAENLNYEAKGSKCYDNDPANCQKYGRLYDWETAKTVCPAGWKLPSDRELKDLYLVMESSNEPEGDYCVCYSNVSKLKSKSGWNNQEDGSSSNGTDDFGFSALPGGYELGGFHGIGGNGYWWVDGWVNNWIMNSGGYVCECGDEAGVSKSSVRCVKD